MDVKARSSTATVRLLAQRYSEKIRENLKTKGLFEQTAKNKNSTKTSLIAIIIAVVTFGVPVIMYPIMFALVANFATSFNSNKIIIYVGIRYLPFVIAFSLLTLIATDVSIFISNKKYKTRTIDGIKASKYLDGLKEYMKLAETDRLKFLQSVNGADTSHDGIVKLYEKLLPYAIIFGIEDSWMSELNKYYQFDDVANPDWVTAGVILSASDFHSFNTYTSSTISSSTMSQSSGGSSSFSGGGGGGFSGGGGGGGGGGGW